MEDTSSSIADNQEGNGYYGRGSQLIPKPIIPHKNGGLPQKWVVLERSKCGNHWGLYSTPSLPPPANGHEWAVTKMVTWVCIRREDSELYS